MAVVRAPDPVEPVRPFFRAAGFGASSGLELGAFAGEPRAGVFGAAVPADGVPHVGQAESVASLCGGVSSGGGGFLRGVTKVNLACSCRHPNHQDEATCGSFQV